MIEDREVEEALFHEKLLDLHTLCNELTLTDSVEELCERAVRLGRTRLGFDRLAIWLVGPTPDIIIGTFGTDEQGDTRREWGIQGSAATSSHPLINRILAGEERTILAREFPLLNHCAEVVGIGDVLLAAFWNGRQVIGLVSADNLLTGQPLTDYQRELLELYAASLGHLYSLKQTEEALRHSEAKHRAFIEQIPTITYTDSLDDPGATLFVSRQVETILHYSADELMQQPSLWFEQLLHPEDRERVFTATRHCHETGEPLNIEYRMLTRDGRMVWLRDSAVVVRDAAGLPLFLQGVALDVTRQKEVELALREQLRFAQQLMDTIPSPIFYKNTRGEYLGCNSAFEAHLGLSRERILGKTVFDLHEYAHAQQHHAQDQPLMRHGGVRVAEGFEQFADGSLHHVQYTKAAFTNEEGQVLGVVGVMLDITERKQMEEALRATNERLRSLITASPLAIITTTLAGTITGWNFTAERMFGWREDEVLNCANPLSTACARDNAPHGDTGLWDADSLKGVDGVCTCKDGAALEVSLWTAALHDERGDIAEILYLIEDATERKYATERERMIREMQETEHLRSEFLSFVSHELKTPLTPILGAIELLKSTPFTQIGDTQLILLEMIDRQSRRLQRLINDLLNLFQLENGRMSLKLRRVNLPEVINESILAFEKRYREKGLFLQLKQDALLPAIRGDAQRLGQILDNLLENALKYTDAGGVSITLSTHAHVVRLRIADTGIGLTHGEARRIFEPFYQVQSQRQGGAGLGLAIVKQLVEAQRGKIRVASPGTGQGTIFTLLFPALNEAEQRQPD